jgi:hypothetical protein
VPFGAVTQYNNHLFDDSEGDDSPAKTPNSGYSSRPPVRLPFDTHSENQKLLGPAIFITFIGLVTHWGVRLWSHIHLGVNN